MLRLLRLTLMIVSALAVEEGWAVATRVIARAGAFDLEYIGTHVGQQHGAVRDQPALG